MSNDPQLDAALRLLNAHGLKGAALGLSPLRGPHHPMVEVAEDQMEDAIAAYDRANPELTKRRQSGG